MRPQPNCPVCGKECPLDGKGDYLKTCGDRQCRGTLSRRKMVEEELTEG